MKSLNSLSGKTTALDRIIELGNAINRAYSEGDREPDDFISLEVGMSMSEMKELELEPLASEDILTKPAIGSLIETLKELKITPVKAQRSISTWLSKVY